MLNGKVRRRWLLIMALLIWAGVTVLLVLLVVRRGQDTPQTATVVEEAPKPAPAPAPIVVPAPPPHDDPPPIHLLAPVPTEPPPRAPKLAREAPPPLPPSPLDHDPTAEEVMLLYARTGRELMDLRTAKGENAVVDLSPRYRWIRVNDAIATPENRRQTYDQLVRIRKEIASAR